MAYTGFEPISLIMPTPLDVELTEKLMEEVRSIGVCDSEKTRDLKAAVLKKLDQLAKDFVEKISSEMGRAREIPEECHLKVLSSGLHGLGLPTNKPDIDVLFVGSRLVSRLCFFHDFYNMLKEKGGVKECSAAPNASVPVIRATVDNVEIDIVYAEFPTKDTIPDTLELRDDNMLIGLDVESVRSLSWCRANEEILHLVPDEDNFRNTLRAILAWAKRRQIYSRCFGFLGGDSCTILVAKICQLHPHALPSTLIKAFFRVFSKWKWSWQCPVLLTPFIESLALDKQTWDPKRNPKDKDDLMPIISPVHPRINSTYNVTKSSLKIMKKEFTDGYHVASEVHNDTACWSKLFEEFNFFDEFRHFVVVTAGATDDERFRRWIGLVQSRIRELVYFLESCNSISFIRVNTEHFSPVSQTDKYVRRWFLGFETLRTFHEKELKSHMEHYKIRTVGLARSNQFYTEDMKLEAVYADGQEAEVMKEEKANFATHIPVLINRVPVTPDQGCREIMSSVKTTRQRDDCALPIPPKVRKTD